MLAAALQMLQAAPARTVQGVFIDDDLPTPGKVVMLPKSDPHSAASKPEKVALTAVEHLIHNTEDANLTKAKVVTIEPNDNAKRTLIGRSEASALLSSCHSAGVAQLGAASSANGRQYVLVRVDCSRAVSGGDTLLAAVGIEDSTVKTVFLNVGPLLVMELP